MRRSDNPTLRIRVRVFRVSAGTGVIRDIVSCTASCYALLCRLMSTRRRRRARKLLLRSRFTSPRRNGYDAYPVFYQNWRYLVARKYTLLKIVMGSLFSFRRAISSNKPRLFFPSIFNDTIYYLWILGASWSTNTINVENHPLKIFIFFQWKHLNVNNFYSPVFIRLLLSAYEIFIKYISLYLSHEANLVQ